MERQNLIDVNFSLVLEEQSAEMEPKRLWGSQGNSHFS